ncbi:MAG: nuclear transport factor 2 family protein [Cyclobacteriaceae bacterium]|nr:nuclear transport factor 2 family protein [Cyclobacteriaceae bacterium]
MNFQFRISNHLPPLESNEKLIHQFYTGFQMKDWRAMQSVYHPEAVFSDPVFRHLTATEAKAMWHMLVAAGTDLRIGYADVHTLNDEGHCRWEAHYTFSRTGRAVHNQIRAQFVFRDGKIYRHTDDFSLWKWSAMALGPVGRWLGWTPLVQGQVRKTARQALRQFCQKNPVYGAQSA